MPEGPELYKAAKLVNAVCIDKVFHGKIVRSAVNQKNPEIHHDYDDYTIHAESCGKEMALILKPFSSIDCASNKKNETRNLRILFRFGMSGRFEFTAVPDIHKHAHLSFFTKEDPPMVLSFVDVRRFGSWEINGLWSKNRGPDPMLDYQAFRENVLSNMEDSVFNKPLCEVMHNQKYFNGIGNYLRAEIIYRAGIPPFTVARKVLENLKVKEEIGSQRKNSKCVDILQLCNTVPKEVIQLPGAGYDPSGSHSDYSAFMDWLQCYGNPNMNNLVDHDGRTMWFKGTAGPLAPKGGKTRIAKRYGKRKQQNNETEEPEKKKGTAGPLAPKGGKTRIAKRFGKRKQQNNETEELEKKKVKPMEERESKVKKEKKITRQKGASNKNGKESSTSGRKSRKRK